MAAGKGARLTMDMKQFDLLAGKLKLAKENITEESAKTLLEFGQYVEGESIKLTPIQTGELRSRAFSTLVSEKKTGNMVVVVGYEADAGSWDTAEPYAVAVHENLSAYHHVGQAKFLQTAVNATSGEFLDLMAKMAEGALEDVDG